MINTSFISPSLLKRPALSSEETAPHGFAIAGAQGQDTLMGPVHHPRLEPRDEAIFLLNVVAEVEHALLVQYLYAAYSVRETGDVPSAGHIQQVMLQVAREEMGHLASVQNLLHVLGGPLNFHREQSPIASGLYPFRFKLQPLTVRSLAKYVIAESPFPLPETLPAADRALLIDVIEPQAKADNDNVDVQHVGAFFKRLLELFSDPVDGLRDEDFQLATSGRQASPEDWGFDATGRSDLMGAEPLVVETIDGADVTEIRESAVGLLEKIAEQGEGYDPELDNMESHFDRFLELYKEVDNASDGGTRSITWPIPVNPNVTPAPSDAATPNMSSPVAMVLEAQATTGRITEPTAKLWAQLFNLRYRMLLGFLAHFLQSDGELFESTPADSGDRTPRGLLLIWTFYEMRRVRKIALKLVTMPKDENGDVNAGPPFELPYTLNLPSSDALRWRTHLDVSRAAVRLITQLRAQPGQADDPFLMDLAALDAVDQQIMLALSQGDGIPVGVLPDDFQKVVTILEEAVRGFTIRGHMNFWDRVLRDEFVQGDPGGPNIQPRAGGGFDPDTSRLVRFIERNPGGMPRFRPQIPAQRLAFLREWIERGCPHDGKVGIERERDPRISAAAPPKPTMDQDLSFASDIKPLFREVPDRSAMLIFGIDLHDYQQVSAAADRILRRLTFGDMPCDGAWPPERVARFDAWIRNGKQP